MPSILGIGQSGLAAAQVGITTTGHNIANAATPGYSRQLVLQNSAGGQLTGVGFVGQGTEVSSIQRVYDDYTATRVNSSETSKAAFDTYNAQIGQINNLLADSATGLSPALQDFFSKVQDVAGNPNGAAERQTLLSSAGGLAARFQSLDGQLSQISEGVNKQITGSLTNINSYSQQIAKLNDAIEKATAGANGVPPNDLLDQRDLIVTQLSKEVKVSVSDQAGSGFNVTIGNGQPLVIGTTVFSLQAIPSLTDQSKLEIAYQNGSTLIRVPESAISGGNLGGLFDFRANSLDQARNQLGRVAIGVASAVNAQSQLGLDQNGQPGKPFFTVGVPKVTPSSANVGNDQIGANISDINALTSSDYRIAFDGTNYKITRLSDSAVVSNGAFPSTPIDGITFSKTSGSIAAAVGDNYLVRPTLNGAAAINLALTDKTQIAAAAPIVTAATSSNAGTAVISAGSVNASYLSTPLTATLTLKFNAGTIDSVPAGASGFPQAYSSGSNITFNGITLAITGAPVNGDTFTIAPNTTGVGDGRNAVALGALQTARVLDNSTSTFGSAFGQLVSNVGNKTREVSANAAAEGKLLDNSRALQQSQSGVNLDEEAANLLRYQQAYQAAGKVMQTASTLFDVLLSLGK